MNRYITTTLPYVNSDPHIGFALEIIQADVMARTWRLSNDDVFFTTGTDEHGQKISQQAELAGQNVQEYVDHYAEEFKKLKDSLDLSYDSFIRTTSPAHVVAAQEIWNRCLKAGDIYKKAYTGLYCVGDEMFIRETDLIEGKCPNHLNQDLVEITEENYFFKFSAYQERLLKYLSNVSVIIPEWRRQEAISFVEGGLEDFSISREVARMNWGIPVPGDETQVMYVWFDALTNYISALGWPEDSEGKFKKFWEEGITLQVAGKDQIRFQSLIWQAMLMSADIKTTDVIFYHGFITSAGNKMSKSVGNVISPYELVEKYCTDATRYLLLRHAHSTDDSDITWERLDEWYTANLVNGLGNLVARVMKLAEEYLDNAVELSEDDLHVEDKFTSFVNNFAFNEAMNLIWEHIGKGDEYMTEHAPYKGIKEDSTKEKAKEDIAKLVKHIAKIAMHLKALMPETSERILAAVRDNKKPENIFPRFV